MKPRLEELEYRIAIMLRWGVVLSGALLLIGWILHFRYSAVSLSEFTTYQSVPLLEELSNLTQDPSGLFSLAGLTVLISLPLLRVLATGYLFWKQGERVLAMTAALVFVTILVSCALGLEI